MYLLSVQQIQQIYNRISNVSILGHLSKDIIEYLGFRVDKRGIVQRNSSYNPDWKYTNNFVIQPGNQISFGDELDKIGCVGRYQVLERDVLQAFCRMYFPYQMVVMVEGDNFPKFYDLVKDIPGVHKPNLTGVSTDWVPVVVSTRELFNQIICRFDKMSEIYIYWFIDNELEASWD